MTAEGWTEPAVSSLALLLFVVLELLLALPGDDADFGRSNNEEISTLAAFAGFRASSCEFPGPCKSSFVLRAISIKRVLSHRESESTC